MYTINGIPLTHNVHETLVDDSELYRAQIESGDDVLICNVSNPLLEILLTFFQKKAEEVSLARQVISERNERWRHYTGRETAQEVTLNDIDDHLENQCNSSLQRYLQSLPLKELYEVTEVLNFLMSRSLMLAVKAITHIVDSNTILLSQIANWLEEKPSVVHQQEQQFLDWTTMLETYSREQKKKTYEACPFRFTDDLWIMLKVEIFAYHIVKTAGCSFLSTGALGILARLEPKTDLERKLCTSNFVTKLEMIDDMQRLTEFNEFTLKNCKMTYSNGQTYEGEVYIHPIGGPMKHGSGTLFDLAFKFVVRRGKWIFDEEHDCSEEDCDLCYCENYTKSGDTIEDGDDYDENLDQGLMCYFHLEKKEWNLTLDWDDNHVDFDYCPDCSKVLEPMRQKIDEGFVALLGGTDCGKKTAIKDITTYEDYIKYVK